MKKNKGFGKKHLTESEKEKIIKGYRSGESAAVLSKLFDCHRTTVYKILQKECSEKTTSRKPGSGRPRKMDKRATDRLARMLKKSATRFGFETALWNTERVRTLCKKEIGVKISRTCVWEYLKRIDYSCKKVQKTYREADPKARGDWLKKTVKKIRRVVKTHRAILYFEDESTISLSPVMGTSWSKRGTLITAKVTGKRGSVSAISAVSNDGRLLFSLHDSGKRFNSEDIVDFLKKMLDHHKRRHLVVVMDRAPCHVSKKVKAFTEGQKRLHVFYLPTYSPDLNPDEKIWNHLKNIELKCHDKQTTGELKKFAGKKLRKMSRSKRTIRAVFKRCDYADTYL